MGDGDVYLTMTHEPLHTEAITFLCRQVDGTPTATVGGVDADAALLETHEKL